MEIEVEFDDDVEAEMIKGDAAARLVYYFVFFISTCKFILRVLATPENYSTVAGYAPRAHCVNSSGS